MFFVYVDHTNEPTPRAFYVGKGIAGRVNDMRRNQHHKFVVKHLGLCREIVFISTDEQAALQHEIDLIAELRTYNPEYKLTLDDIRCNKTKGGEGTSGWKHSAEWRRKQRERMSGSNHPGYGKPGNRTGMHNSLEMRQKQSDSLMGEKHPLYGKPAYNRGVKSSPEAVENNRRAQLKWHAMHPETDVTRQRKRNAQLNRWAKVRAEKGSS